MAMLEREFIKLCSLRGSSCKLS